LAGIARIPYAYFTSSYEFFQNGMVKVSVEVRLRENLHIYLPRFGFEFASPVANDCFTYYGMGEMESYCDMNLHAKMGLYKSDARNEYVEHITPQEHGNHYNTKYLEMGNGLCFMTNTCFEFRVSEYSTKMLEEATHTDEVKTNGYTNIRIDYKVSGVGSSSVGPELLERYRLNDSEFLFEFYMI